jgi:futalosine hydrolase
MQIQRLLIISAVKEELSPLFNFLKIQQTNNNLVEIEWNSKKIFFGFTGVGMINSAVYTSKFIFESKCDFAIQAGIAGCFNYDNKLSETVEITHEFISEMFAQDGDKNIEMKSLNLIKEDSNSVYTSMGIENTSTLFPNLQKCRGITVNTIHGNETKIEQLKKRYYQLFGLLPHSESMEGAAFFTACKANQVPCAQIRSFSNYVETRNRENWKIIEAIENLNKELIVCLENNLN